MNNIFMIPSLVKWYGSYSGYDYSDLTEEEKAYLNFYDECLFNSSEKISNASSKMQMLILEFIARSEAGNQMTVDEVIMRKQEIMNGLTEKEIQTVYTFGYACSRVVGIFSEERKEERRLKRELSANKEIHS